MKEYQWETSIRAIDDVEEAVTYYNKYSFGLGNKFLSEINDTIRKITRNPFAFSIKYDNVRCAALKKFPFSIHYTINEKNISVTIVAVFNTYKEPFW